MTQPLDRRHFLGQCFERGLLGAGALGVVTQLTDPLAAQLSTQGKGRRKKSRYKTQRVILVAFSGGVRSKEVLDTPENVPNLMKIAGAGVTFPNVRATNLGHYGAALSIFTGNAEAMSIRDNKRGLSPTIFEYLRKDCGFGSNDIWLSTANGAQGRLFAYSEHPDYGVRYGANVLDSDGIFNKEFKDVLERFGKPKPDGDRAQKILKDLGDAIDPGQLGRVEGRRPDVAQTRRVEKFILDELRGKNTRITGPGAADAKAIRIGQSILTAFRPKLLGITLQTHDIAHGSFNGYVEVIRRNDAELGKLWAAVQADPELRDTTTILVCPEFGRDENLNERNGLDHGDGSDSLRRVFMIAAGPDFKTGKIVKKPIRTLDLCPTVMSLFAKKKPSMSSASIIKDAFA